MKKLITILLFTIIPLIAVAQKDYKTLFIEYSFDAPVLLDKERVGGGNLDHLLRVGIEDGITIAIFYEQFNEINFTAYGVNVGYMYRMDGYEVNLNFWPLYNPINLDGLSFSADVELGYIDRLGIKDTIQYTDTVTNLYLGGNIRIKYELNDTFFIGTVFKLRPRPDLGFYYDDYKTEKSLYVTVGARLF